MSYHRVSVKSGRWISLAIPDKYPFFPDIFYCKGHLIEESLKEASTSLSPPGMDLKDDYWGFT